MFHDIVSGLSCSPIGFEVVDLAIPYHALLGRPALAKFMAVPHYTYLKLNMSGPKGLITIVDDYKKFLECVRAGSKLAESLVIAEGRRQLDQIVAVAGERPTMPAPAKESDGEASF